MQAPAAAGSWRSRVVTSFSASDVGLVGRHPRRPGPARGPRAAGRPGQGRHRPCRARGGRRRRQRSAPRDRAPSRAAPAGQARSQGRARCRGTPVRSQIPAIEPIEVRHPLAGRRVGRERLQARGAERRVGQIAMPRGRGPVGRAAAAERADRLVQAALDSLYSVVGAARARKLLGGQPLEQHSVHVSVAAGARHPVDDLGGHRSRELQARVRMPRGGSGRAVPRGDPEWRGAARRLEQQAGVRRLRRSGCAPVGPPRR